MGVAFRTGALRLRAGPRDPALRKARVCYDHLAGELSVQIFESLLKRGALALSGDGLTLTPNGRRFFKKAGIDAAALQHQRRPFCRACLDWSERRHHLAGALGAALLEHMMARRWARRDRESRVVNLTTAGEKAIRELFRLPDIS